MALAAIRSSLGRLLTGLGAPAPAASDLAPSLPGGLDEQPRLKPRISLLSVVREKRGTRYMAVEHIADDVVECAWMDAGLRQTGSFPIDSLEVVPPLQGDDQLWREAFRAGWNSKVG